MNVCFLLNVLLCVAGLSPRHTSPQLKRASIALFQRGVSVATMPGAGARRAQQEFQQTRRIMQYAEQNYVQYQWREPCVAPCTYHKRKNSFSDYANDSEAILNQDPFGMAVVQQPLPETSLVPESATPSVPTAAQPTVMPGADDTRVLRQQIYGTDHVPSLASCPPRIRSILTSAKYSNQLEEHHVVELKKFLLQQCNQGNPIAAITAIRRFMPQMLQQKVFDPVTKDMCDKAARKAGIIRSEDQVPDDIGIDTSCAGNQGRAAQQSFHEDFTNDDFFSTPSMAAPIKMSIDDATKNVYQTSTSDHVNDDKQDEIIEDDGCEGFGSHFFHVIASLQLRTSRSPIALCSRRR